MKLILNRSRKDSRISITRQIISLSILPGFLQNIERRLRNNNAPALINNNQNLKLHK